MKRNLFFLFILFIFLGISYWIDKEGQEKRSLFFMAIDEKPKSLLLPNLKINFAPEGKYFSFSKDGQKIFLPSLKVEKILSAFSNLKIERIYEQKEIDSNFMTQAFPDDLSQFVITFSFESTKMMAWLGAKLQHSDQFYLRIKRHNLEKIFLVRDISPLDSAYPQGQRHLVSEKYDNLRKIFFMGLNDLLE